MATTSIGHGLKTLYARLCTTQKPCTNLQGYHKARGDHPRSYPLKRQRSLVDLG